MKSSAGSFRLLSGLELLAGAAIVVGHNVFRIVPNEVIILAVLGLLSVRMRNGSWFAMGFKRPESWRLVLLVALAAAAFRILAGDHLVLPITDQFWPEPIAPEGVEDISGDLRTALLYLLLVWSFAAFGEEIAYRGYLMTRAAELLGGSRAAWWIAVIVVAVLFGIGHWYKGPSGVVDSGMAGLVLGASYLLTGRNMWTCVLAHGFIDTFGVAALYFGWDN
jgi:membrane protease YdiL (CAAX protease family)